MFINYKLNLEMVGIYYVLTMRISMLYYPLLWIILLVSACTFVPNEFVRELKRPFVDDNEELLVFI